MVLNTFALKRRDPIYDFNYYKQVIIPNIFAFDTLNKSVLEGGTWKKPRSFKSEVTQSSFPISERFVGFPPVVFLTTYFQLLLILRQEINLQINNLIVFLFVAEQIGLTSETDLFCFLNQKRTTA